MTKLSHIDEQGAAHMVDVGGKNVTERIAVAEGYVHMAPETLKLILSDGLPKGDVLAAARLAGIMAAKKTSDLIPLCHPLMITSVKLDLAPAGDDRIRIEARVKVSGQTGVEMEALTAVSVAALTLYDMAKAADKAMRIDGIRLLRKEGGKSGTYEAKP
ncbi:cyclic pyranopterin monophosphate synthase MoaC [Kordiimonas marina]|uniref:cyclic pyranopterin monophosphate synthase MoaC n=1 Tax=Kordiimonas marina TaxID=2872312 RepID=UPI001FF6DB13|nr:cyclic pyranopterin monophosphate synthase MoaC [Kordiimonas marina]MCJ9428765.1 cyclic pyranopterin monophosphate synthase MoaC [Kordiimonas marina]